MGFIATIRESFRSLVSPTEILEAESGLDPLATPSLVKSAPVPEPVGAIHESPSGAIRELPLLHHRRLQDRKIGPLIYGHFEGPTAARCQCVGNEGSEDVGGRTRAALELKERLVTTTCSGRIRGRGAICA